MKIALQRVLRKMSTDFPTAAVGSSQAPTATVEKSQRLEHKNSDSPLADNDQIADRCPMCCSTTSGRV